jgi:hypothetical protein
LAKEGGCPFNCWGSWEARLVEEGREEEGLAENLAMAGSFMCQAQVSNVRERHNINVYRPRYDVEKIISMSDFDNDKNRSRYI